MKKVAVIIVTYNGQKYLPDLLGSIFESVPVLVEQKIIIVDNCSTDSSISWIKENYPQVIILEQEKNLGFAAGNNIGIRYAIDHNYDYVMLLNQDTIVTNGYLDKLVSELELDEQIVAVQPKIMLYPLTELVNSLGNVIHYLGFGYTYGHKLPNFEFRSLRPKDFHSARAHGEGRLRDLNFEINYCSGAACLLKVEALKKVGLFDEDLFMYHEDLDLGWRLRLAGYRNIINPEAVVYHKYEFSRSIQKYYYLERNRFKVIFQNYHLLTILLILPALLVMELGLFIFSFINGWWKEKLMVYLYFLNPINWLKIFKKRQKIRQIRVKNDKKIVEDFSGLIEHQEIENIFLKFVNPIFNLYWQIIKRLIFW